MSANAQLEAPEVHAGSGNPMKTTTAVEGMVAPGFEEVRTEFERNFAAR